ncbi:MAG: thiamine-phosphate kinase [Mariprofundaceae bacterium]|nr:thiamine-phosphate kinase [Mariprofundaceae bacterium]
MSASEFDLIHACFRKEARIFSAMTRVGNGDDASVHDVPEGQQLVVSTDTAVAGVHWPHDFPVAMAADRAVCAALSDLAAMGAKAHWAWVSVMASDEWVLQGMGKGVTAALNRYDVELSGGDTVQSPLNALTITVSGLIPEKQAMQRNQAKVGDDVWLLGRVGFSSLGLNDWFSGVREGGFIADFQTVEPKLRQGETVRDLGVCCCMDVSDGLLQDAGHVCHASGIGMNIELASLPEWGNLVDAVGEAAAMQAMLSGGEDYALLLTAPSNISGLSSLAVKIGSCVKGNKVSVHLHGASVMPKQQGFDHFGE